MSSIDIFTSGEVRSLYNRMNEFIEADDLAAVIGAVLDLTAAEIIYAEEKLGRRWTDKQYDELLMSNAVMVMRNVYEDVYTQHTKNYHDEKPYEGHYAYTPPTPKEMAEYIREKYRNKGGQ